MESFHHHPPPATLAYSFYCSLSERVSKYKNLTIDSKSPEMMQNYPKEGHLLPGASLTAPQAEEVYTQGEVTERLSLQHAANCRRRANHKADISSQFRGKPAAFLLPHAPLPSHLLDQQDS